MKTYREKNGQTYEFNLFHYKGKETRTGKPQFILTLAPIVLEDRGGYQIATFELMKVKRYLIEEGMNNTAKNRQTAETKALLMIDELMKELE